MFDVVIRLLRLKPVDDLLYINLQQLLSFKQIMYHGTPTEKKHL